MSNNVKDNSFNNVFWNEPSRMLFSSEILQMSAIFIPDGTTALEMLWCLISQKCFVF